MLCRLRRRRNTGGAGSATAHSLRITVHRSRGMCATLLIVRFVRRYCQLLINSAAQVPRTAGEPSLCSRLLGADVMAQSQFRGLFDSPSCAVASRSIAS